MPLFVKGDQCFKTTGPGPHPTSCLRIWWMDAGCTMDGIYAPHDQESDSYWNMLDVSHVQYDMSLYFNWAMEGRGPYPIECFGMP